MNKKTRHVTLLNKQGSKRYNVYNMRPFVKLTKKQYRSSGRYNYIYAVEYKKKLYRQNVLSNVLYNCFQKDKIYYKNFFKRENIYNKNKYHFNRSHILPFASIAKYSAFLNGSSLWSIQRQTTALQVFPQSSSFWLYSLDMLETNFLRIAPSAELSLTLQGDKKNINRKNTLWTAGFVRIRKLRQYYKRQLCSTQKLLYWYSYASYKKINKTIQKIYQYNRGTKTHIIWSIISLLDSLWTNIIVKSNFVYTSSASSFKIKQKIISTNGFIIKKGPFRTKGKPGDIFYK